MMLWRSFCLRLIWLSGLLLAFTGAFGQTYVMMPDSTNNLWCCLTRRLAVW